MLLMRKSRFVTNGHENFYNISLPGHDVKYETNADVPNHVVDRAAAATKFRFENLLEQGDN
jgi:hypothetical protein